MPTTCRLNGKETTELACQNQKSAPIPAGGQDLFSHCRECAGPIMTMEVVLVEVPQKRETMSLKAQFRALGDMEPWIGTACGHEKPKSEFYPYDFSRCKECIRERTRHTNPTRKRRVTKAIEELPVKVVEKQDIPEAPRFPREAKGERIYRCEFHGDHAGSLVGGKFCMACPVCAEEKRIQKMREADGNRVTIDFNGEPWLLEWIKRQAINGEGAPAIIMGIILEAIPSGELKTMLIESKRSAAK